MARQKIHEAKLTITRQLTIPQKEKGGVVLELRANKKLLGAVIFSGAHVYFEKGKTKKYWNFTDFVELLKSAQGTPY